MKNYSSQNIQDISAEFRNVAQRLSRTDYSQCDANLKRFISIIESNELIFSFIDKNNIKKYDISLIIKERGWLDPFEISPLMSEEISFEYQLLSYAIENFNGDFTSLYNTHHYISTKSTTNDEMHKFIEHIIDPLIDYIGEYLRQCCGKALREEKKDAVIPASGITAHNSTVVIGSQVEGNVTTKVTINNSVQQDADKLISSIFEALKSEKLKNIDEITEILSQIQDDVKASQKPKKGFLSVLKNLCTGGKTVVPLVKDLIELFSQET